jgi:hypothetical protein
MPRREAAKSDEPKMAPSTWEAVFIAEAPPDRRAWSPSATQREHSPWRTGTLQFPAAQRTRVAYTQEVFVAMLYAENLAACISRQICASNASRPRIACESTGRNRNCAATSVRP